MQLKCGIDKNFVMKVPQILRYRRPFTLSIKVNETSTHIFPYYIVEMLNTCARAGVTRYDKSNKSEFLQIPSSHFARLVLTFFLKIPLAAYPNVTKNCNSRAIKQFNGQKLRDFHFLSVFGARGNS